MEESSFEIDVLQLAKTATLFPARRLVDSESHPAWDVSYLAAGSEFSRHAWDEAGSL
jgi:hypothetical protein